MEVAAGAIGRFVAREIREERFANTRVGIGGIK
jgi:hypothetical protein